MRLGLVGKHRKTAAWRSWFTYSQSEWYRIAGWAILLFVLLWAPDVWNQGGIYPLLLDVLLLLGLSSILRAGSPFGHSQTTLELFREHLSQKRIGSSRIHWGAWSLSSFKKKKRNLQEEFPLLAAAFAVGAALSIGIFGLIAEPAWQLLLTLCLMLGVTLFAVLANNRSMLGLAVGSALVLLITSTSATAAMVYTAIFCIGWLWFAWQDRYWWLYGVAVLGAYLGVTHWLLAGLPNAAALYAVPMLLLGFSYFISLPMVLQPRKAQDREVLRTVLVGNFLFAEWLIIIANPITDLTLHILLNLLPGLLALGFAGLSYYLYGRRSYSKYFGFIALGVAVSQLLIYLPGGWLSLSLLIIATILLMFGAGQKSFSMRMAGLGFLLISLVVYITEVLFAGSAVEGMVGKVGLGIIYAGVLPLIGDWYAELDLTGRERHQKPLMVSSLYAVAVAILFTLVFTLTMGWLQSILWICIGLVAIILANLKKVLGLVWAGKILISAALLKLLLVDLLLEGLSTNYATPAVCSLIVLAILLFATPLRERWQRALELM